jgi:hypothetical protein
MTSIGVLLVILGVGSLVLPAFNLQFRLMEIVDPYQPWAGIIAAALGLVLILVASRRKSGDVKEAEEAAAPAAASAPAAAATPPPSASPPPVSASTAAPAAPAEPTSDPWPTTPPERHDD